MPFIETSILKLDGCVLIDTLLLSQSDAGDKLGCSILCAGGGMALQICCCMSEENCCCMADGNLAMLKG